MNNTFQTTDMSTPLVPNPGHVPGSPGPHPCLACGAFRVLIQMLAMLWGETLPMYQDCLFL